MLGIILYMVGMLMVFLILPLTPLGKDLVEYNNDDDNIYYVSLLGIMIFWPLALVVSLIYYSFRLLVRVTKLYLKVLKIEISDD